MQMFRHCALLYVFSRLLPQLRSPDMLLQKILPSTADITSNTNAAGISTRSCAVPVNTGNSIPLNAVARTHDACRARTRLWRRASTRLGHRRSLTQHSICAILLDSWTWSAPTGTQRLPESRQRASSSGHAGRRCRASGKRPRRSNRPRSSRLRATADRRTENGLSAKWLTPFSSPAYRLSF